MLLQEHVPVTSKETGETRPRLLETFTAARSREGVAAEGSSGCKAVYRGWHTLERGGERMYTDFQTGEPLPRAHGTCESAHLAPVMRLWAVGHARTVPAASVEEYWSAQPALRESRGGTDAGR